jgi:hypothetical protein
MPLPLAGFSGADPKALDATNNDFVLNVEDHACRIALVGH